ncbi:MAG: hypothetical protein KDC12_05175 [Flavobacteriales bacterium]|nr:hypothetical protein [Flavobacteriales bacterium]
MTPQKTQIAHLIQLAKADGELDHKEVLLIYGIAHKNGISKFEMDEIVSQSEHSYQYTIPDSEEDKIKYFYQLLIMATVDFEVNLDEVILLKNIGDRFGLDSEKVQRAIDYIIDNHKTDIDDAAVASLLL